MTDLAHSSTPYRQRRYWVTEIAVIVGFIVLAGFGLLASAQSTPDQLFADLGRIVTH